MVIHSYGFGPGAYALIRLGRNFSLGRHLRPLLPRRLKLASDPTYPAEVQ